MKKDPRTWVWVPPVEQEVDEELAFHLEMHTRDLIANGMAPDAAREAARQHLGDLHRLRRECVSLGRKRDRIMRITQWIEDSLDDLRVATRRLKQSPGFTLAAVGTLALGIGANSAIFTLADAALLRPLRFPEADRLVMIHERSPNGDRSVVAPAGATHQVHQQVAVGIYIERVERRAGQTLGLGHLLNLASVEARKLLVRQKPHVRVDGQHRLQ